MEKIKNIILLNSNLIISTRVTLIDHDRTSSGYQQFLIGMYSELNVITNSHVNANLSLMCLLMGMQFHVLNNIQQWLLLNLS